MTVLVAPTSAFRSTQNIVIKLLQNIKKLFNRIFLLPACLPDVFVAEKWLQLRSYFSAEMLQIHLRRNCWHIDSHTIRALLSYFYPSVYYSGHSTIWLQSPGVYVSRCYCTNILEYMCRKFSELFSVVDEMSPASRKWTACGMICIKHMYESVYV